RGCPPGSAATIAPTGYRRAPPRHSLYGGCFPDRNARRGPAACVQRRVVPARCPPFATLPRAVVPGVARMRRIHWSNRTPVTVLIDEPSTWSQTLDHASDSRLLLAREPEQHQT